MPIQDLAVPIIQAPIGSVASTTLAAAVSNAGGMGSLAMTWTPPETASRLVERMNTATAAPYLINFVLAFPLVSFDAALEAGARAISLSWGHDRALIEKAHRRGVPVGVQVGTVDGAKQALSDGADFIICQGVEAGGHVQSTTGRSLLLEQVTGLTTDIPIVAAGGLASGEDIRQALGEGASAVMLGTRFVATQESRAHSIYKDAIVDAKATDTAYTLCFNGNWPYAGHRVLRNETLMSWETAGCPPVGSRPGEGDVIGQEAHGADIIRYDDTPPLANTTGDIMATCLYAGMGVDSITDVPTVAEMMKRLWREADYLNPLP